MNKRGQNEGSIYYDESRKRWMGAVSVGEGKRRKVSGVTKKEVQEKLTALLRDHQTGMLPTGPRQTVEAYLNHWLENVAQQNVRPRTYDRYVCLLKKHVIPYLGKKPLEKLSGQDLQTLYNRLGVTTKEKKGLHPRTIGHVHRCLHKALEDALRLGLIPRNVCDLVSPPKAPTPKRTFYSKDQALTFLTAIKGHRFEALFTLALTTGMRQGELFALKWSDVQLDSSVLYVRRTIYRRNGHGWVWGEPKSETSNRRIELIPLAVKALRQLRANQLQRQLLAGPDWEGHDLVFCNNRGGPLTGDSFSREQLYPLLEKEGLERIRFHDLRHSCASIMLELGVQPKVVQELLGHSSFGITMDIYSHVAPNLQREAMNHLDRALEGY